LSAGPVSLLIRVPVEEVEMVDLVRESALYELADIDRGKNFVKLG
jgi:hypothetical protein